MQTFDSIVLGSGQAGTPLAFKLASEGQRVAFIEKNEFGGSCVNVGCTPTKAYLASSRRMWETQNGSSLGVEIPPGSKANLKKIKSRKDAIIQESIDGIKKGVENEKKITYFHGEAFFTGEKVLSVNNIYITAEKIYINVGARPHIPEGFKQLPYLTNESILELKELPEHLIIIGGSYIGLEFGQIFRRFGSKISIVEKNKTIISKEDDDISKEIINFMEDEGIQFHLNSECISGKLNDDNSLTITFNCNKKNQEIQGSHLLIAVGRIPNSDTLNLEKTGVKTDECGYIIVNDKLETNVKGIYALGDCNGKGAFTHTSYNDYEIIVANALEGKNRKVSDRIKTYCLYLDPPLGRAGLTLKEAKEKDLNIGEAFLPMHKVARAKEKGETKGFMRILVDKDTKQIVGASVLGTGGDEIISGILNLMYAKASYTVIRDSVIPHPTVAELIPTMLENLNKVN